MLWLGRIGLLTTVMESAATAVGAGMILGAFGAGAFGVLVGWTRSEMESSAVTFGYYGGIVAALVALFDFVLAYIV